MGRGMRFLVVMALQFVIAVIFIDALKRNDSEMVVFTAGAAVMVFVLMLIIFLLSSISNKDIK